MGHIQKDLNILEPATANPEDVGAAVSSHIESEQVEKLGFIPQHSHVGEAAEIASNRDMPVLRNAVDPVVIEHYRRLRTKILQMRAASPFRTLVITSPSPKDGKTLTVLNLGLSFAMLPSFKVLLVDGDLRRGSLGKRLGMANRPGLSNLIDGSAQFEDVLTSADHFPFHFIGCGTSQVPAAELLQSYELKSKFAKFARHFSLVLVDSPPANLLTDVQLLAAHCDAVLMIARAYSTTRKAFEKAVHDVSSFRVIGTVLNGGMRTPLYRRYKGYY
jgi:capsular exopolysaccharide synthesis family protein